MSERSERRKKKSFFILMSGSKVTSEVTSGNQSTAIKKTLAGNRSWGCVLYSSRSALTAGKLRSLTLGI